MKYGGSKEKRKIFFSEKIDPQTAQLFVLDDDGDIREGDFEIDIFEDGFEYMED